MLTKVKVIYCCKLPPSHALRTRPRLICSCNTHWLIPKGPFWIVTKSKHYEICMHEVGDPTPSNSPDCHSLTFCFQMWFGWHTMCTHQNYYFSILGIRYWCFTHNAWLAIFFWMTGRLCSWEDFGCNHKLASESLYVLSICLLIIRMKKHPVKTKLDIWSIKKFIHETRHLKFSINLKWILMLENVRSAILPTKAHI